MSGVSQRRLWAHFARLTRQLGGQIFNPGASGVSPDPLIWEQVGNGNDLNGGRPLGQQAGGGVVSILRNSAFCSLNIGNGVVTFSSQGFYVVEIEMGGASTAGAQRCTLSAVGSVGGHWGPQGDQQVAVAMTDIGCMPQGRIWSRVQIAVNEQVTPTAQSSLSWSPWFCMVSVYRVA